jgi:hypothetical protein
MSQIGAGLTLTLETAVVSSSFLCYRRIQKDSLGISKRIRQGRYAMKRRLMTKRTRFFSIFLMLERYSQGTRLKRHRIFRYIYYLAAKWQQWPRVAFVGVLS